MIAPVAGQQPGLGSTARVLLDLVGDRLKDEERLHGLRRAAADGELWSLATAQGLEGGLAERVVAVPGLVQGAWSGRLDDLQAARIGARARWSWLRNRAALTLLAAQEVGLDLVPIKGLWVAQRYYPRPHEREMSDLDFVVGPDVDEIVRTLQAAGARHAYFDPAVRAYERHYGCHISILLPGARPLLAELHWRLYPEQPGEAVDQLLSRCRSGRCAGVSARVPSHEDQLLVSAHHLVINMQGPPRWRWWLDIERMIRGAQTDWSSLLERAVAWGDLLPLSLALTGAVQLFSSPVPPWVWGELWQRFTTRERKLAARAIQGGAYHLSRDAVLSVIWRDRAVGWRPRTLLRLLWPHPGEVARQQRICSTSRGFLRARIRFMARRLRQLTALTVGSTEDEGVTF